MRALLLLFIIFSNNVFAAENTSIPSTTEDPFVLCEALDKSLPKSMNKIRKLDKVFAEKSAPDTEYCESYAGKFCTINDISMEGLKLGLITQNKSKETSVLVATISNSKWKLLGDITVGQNIEYIENKFGVTIPRNISPVEIVGDCTPLHVWHKGGIITKLKIDCQACI